MWIPVVLWYIFILPGFRVKSLRFFSKETPQYYAQTGSLTTKPAHLDERVSVLFLIYKLNLDNVEMLEILTEDI